MHVLVPFVANQTFVLWSKMISFCELISNVKLPRWKSISFNSTQNVKKRSKFGDFLWFEQGTQSLYMSSERMLHLLVLGFMTNVWLFHYGRFAENWSPFELCWSTNIYYLCGPGMQSENTCKDKNVWASVNIWTKIRVGPN